VSWRSCGLGEVVCLGGAGEDKEERRDGGENAVLEAGREGVADGRDRAPALRIEAKVRHQRNREKGGQRARTNIRSLGETKKELALGTNASALRGGKGRVLGVLGDDDGMRRKGTKLCCLCCPGCVRAGGGLVSPDDLRHGNYPLAASRDFVIKSAQSVGSPPPPGSHFVFAAMSGEYPSRSQSRDISVTALCSRLCTRISGSASACPMKVHLKPDLALERR